MLEVIYIVVGIIAVLAVSFFAMNQCFYWFLEMAEQWREPALRAHATRKFKELALAFNDDPRMKYIFETIADNTAMGFSWDTWKLRDEVHEKFEKVSTSK